MLHNFILPKHLRFSVAETNSLPMSTLVQAEPALMGLRWTVWACKSPSTATTEERGRRRMEQRRMQSYCTALESVTTSFPSSVSPLFRILAATTGRAPPPLPPAHREVFAGDALRRPLPRFLRRRVPTRYASAPLPFPLCGSEHPKP